MIQVWCPKCSVPVDLLGPKSRVAHKKDDIISILMHKYTYTNMYIIKKSGGYKICLYLKIISYSTQYKTYSGIQCFVLEKPTRPHAK